MLIIRFKHLPLTHQASSAHLSVLDCLWTAQFYFLFLWDLQSEGSIARVGPSLMTPRLVRQQENWNFADN